MNDGISSYYVTILVHEGSSAHPDNYAHASQLLLESEFFGPDGTISMLYYHYPLKLEENIICGVLITYKTYDPAAKPRSWMGLRA